MSAACDSSVHPARVLVCFALSEEAKPFRERIAAHPEVGLLVTGMGKQNAGQSLRAWLASRGQAEATAANHPKLVLTCGFAGALDSALALGEVVFSADNESGLRPKLLSTGAREVLFHCADRIAATAAEKRALRQTTGADAVEMESGVIRCLCREHGLPSATVRVISDTAEEDLPLDFNLLTTADQRMDYAKLALALVKSPGKVAALLRLQRQTRHAAERLAETLVRILG